MRDGNDDIHNECNSRRRRFWTSYEGWKHSSLFVAPEKSQRFWTSYEGWKLKPPRLPCLYRIVFELPMRDGNLRNSHSRKLQSYPFLNFLWGMETASQLTSPSVDTMFLNFLWGMETHDACFGHVTSLSFWTSYEGWKLTNRQRPSFCGKSFWTSYEGWKQRNNTKYSTRTC